LANIKTIKQ